MSQPPKDPARPLEAIRPISSAAGRQECDATEKMLCERCGAEMYRMHAVWRCSSCGFKTDCCGW